MERKLGNVFIALYPSGYETRSMAMFMTIDCVSVCIDVEAGRYIFAGRRMEDRESIAMAAVSGAVNSTMKPPLRAFKDRVKALHHW